MCGRYVLTSSPSELAQRYGATIATDMGDLDTARVNVAPSAQVFGVRLDRSGETRLLDRFQWGLVPSWAKDPSIGQKLFNARDDSVVAKASFRAAFAKRRLLIPADGFFEWLPMGNRRRQPYLFQRRDDRPLAFAGLWEFWRDSTEGRDGGESLVTCTIITTSANSDVRRVHDRMPVILEPQVWDLWLGADDAGEEELRSLLAPAAEGTLSSYPVDPRIGDPRNDSVSLLAPFEVPEGTLAI